MKLVNLTCPGCGGFLERIGDNLCCKSCGAAYAIDYDEADIEHEKLLTEDERAQREAQRTQMEFEHQKELMELQYRQAEESRIAAEKRNIKRARRDRFSKAVKARISGLIALLIVFGFFFGSYMFVVKSGLTPSIKEIMESATATTNQFAVTPDMITSDVLENMIDSGMTTRKNAGNGVTEWNGNEWIDYTLETVEYDSSYYIDGTSVGHNRVVIIYKLTYSSSMGEKVTYDGMYFDELKVDQNGRLIPNYSPDRISRSSAAWNSDSFEDREQCYRESVLQLGGTVTELTR